MAQDKNGGSTSAVRCMFLIIRGQTIRYTACSCSGPCALVNLWVYLCYRRTRSFVGARAVRAVNFGSKGRAKLFRRRRSCLLIDVCFKRSFSFRLGLPLSFCPYNHRPFVYERTSTSTLATRYYSLLWYECVICLLDAGPHPLSRFHQTVLLSRGVWCLSPLSHRHHHA